MDVNMYAYPAGDPQLIDKIYNEFLSQGRFDKLRKECMANADTKPAYQNLQQRVENTVAQFLRKQTWKPDLNKNHLRDSLRKHILDSGFLDSGINRIVDQVVNPNVLQTVFLPEVEEVVYSYFNIPRPVDRQQRRNEPAFLDNNLNPPGVVETNDFQIEVEIGSRSEDVDANGNRSEILFDRLKREDEERDDFKNQNFENELKDKKPKITDSTESLFEKISNESFCTEDKSEIGNDSKENNPAEDLPDNKTVEKMELPSDESQESLSRIGVEKLQITNEADNNTNGADSDSQGGLEIDERTMSESENSNDSILQAMSPISQGRLTPEPEFKAEAEEAKAETETEIKQETEPEPEAEKPREKLAILEEKHPLTFVGRIPKIKKEEEEKGKEGKSVDSSDDSANANKSDSDDKKKVEEKKNDKKDRSRDDKKKRDDKDRKKDDKSRSDRSKDRKKDDKSKKRDDKDRDRDRDRSRGDKSKDRSDKKSSSSSHRSSSSSHHKTSSSHRDDSRSRDRDRGRHDDRRRDDRKRSDDRKKREDDKKKKSKSVDDHSKERSKKDDRRSTDRDSNERERDKSSGGSRSQGESSRRKEKETKGESSREKTGKEEKDRNERRSRVEDKELKKPKTEKKVYFSPDDECEEVYPQEQTEFSFAEIQKIIFGAMDEPEVKPETEAEVVAESEGKTETEAAAESEAKTEMEAEIKTEPENDTEVKPEILAESKPEMEIINETLPLKIQEENISSLEENVSLVEENISTPEEKTPPPGSNYPDLLKEGALKKHAFPPVPDDFYQKFESTGFKYFEDWESRDYFNFYDCEDEFRDFITRAENDMSLISDDESDSEFNFDEANTATVKNSADGFGNFDGGLMLDPVSGDFYSWTNKIFYDKVISGDKNFPAIKSEMETDEDEQTIEEKNKENQELKKSKKKSTKSKNVSNKNKSDILCFSNKKTDESDAISALSDEKINEVPEDNISPPLSEDNETDKSSEKTPKSEIPSSALEDDDRNFNPPKLNAGGKIRRQRSLSKTPKIRILARSSSSKSDDDSDFDLNKVKEENSEEKTETIPEEDKLLGKRKVSEQVVDTPNKIKKDDLKVTDGQPKTKPKIRLGLPRPKQKIKTPKANNSPVNEFSMPLSPESDDTPLNNGAPIPGLNKRKRAPFTSPNIGAIPLKKTVDIKKRTLQQKYDSQDLYKPRPVLTGSRTRNRSLGVVDSPTTKANNVEDTS